MKSYRKLQIQLTYNVLYFTHRIKYRALQKTPSSCLRGESVIKFFSVPFHKC